MTARQLIVVDCETTGLRSEDIPVEVAWRNIDTGDHGHFVPRHDVRWVRDFGEPVALKMNGYHDRLAAAQQDDGTEARRLFQALRGNCLAGSNPLFDAGHLEQVFLDVSDHVEDLIDFAKDARPFQPWHHRLPDVSNYAAGVVGIDPRELPGLATVCELLGVELPDHTAQGDVDSAAACFEACAGLIADAAAQDALARRDPAPEPPPPTWWARIRTALTPTGDPSV